MLNVADRFYVRLVPDATRRSDDTSEKRKVDKKTAAKETECVRARACSLFSPVHGLEQYVKILETFFLW